jgi:hypothetical protein
MKKDLNYIAKLERAISKKYGDEAVQNPKSGWTPEKEKDYLRQLKDLERSRKTNQGEKVEIQGFLTEKKLLNRETDRICTVCSSYSFDMKDDIYMIKYDACFKCFIKYIDNRVERWQQGWRPDEKNSQ